MARWENSHICQESGGGVLQEGEVMAAGGASDHRRVGQTLLGIQMNEYFEGGLTVFPMSRFGVFSLLSVASQGSEGLGLSR